LSKTERLARLGAATGLFPLLRRLRTWNGVLAFGYHRIAFTAGPYDGGVLDATPPQFEEQVRLLAKEFDVITPDELDAVVRRGRGRYVLISFDDAYRDNFDHARPVLKRHGVRATLFVTTDFLDERRISWWDEIAWMVRTSEKADLLADPWLSGVLKLKPAPEQATRTLIGVYKSLPTDAAPAFLDALADATGTGRHPQDAGDLHMSWEDVRELRASGWQIGGHTVSHAILGRLSADEQEREVGGCKVRIESEVGEAMRYFCYPDGGRDSFNAETRRVIAGYGVEYAFSFYGGYRKFSDWDPYDVRRRGLGPTVSQDRFAMILALPQVFTWR
jgi:peptidoglycan/xylan/chitin deacetylase (PgdA/CDA1 family)